MYLIVMKTQKMVDEHSLLYIVLYKLSSEQHIIIKVIRKKNTMLFLQSLSLCLINLQRILSWLIFQNSSVFCICFRAHF